MFIFVLVMEKLCTLLYNFTFLNKLVKRFIIFVEGNAQEIYTSIIDMFKNIK
jgi:hypothetical protein